MRYEKIDSELFITNRIRLKKMLRPNSIVILHSNDVIPTNADGTMGFRQNNDIFYLTGIDQEETILILFPDFPEESSREILFIKETNEHIRVWEGEKQTKQQATEISEIKKVLWANQFDSTLKRMIYEAENVYLNLNEHDGHLINFESRERRYIKEFREKYPLHKIERFAPLMQKLRVIKHNLEIKLLKKAISITAAGFKRMAGFLKPNVYEYELEAELTHEFLMNRSRNHAFHPIIASGENSCVMHYVTNNKRCKSGEVILMDFGAEYANYNGDMTRCLPVSGQFSDRQKQVYQSVLRILKEATALIVSGNTMDNLRYEVGKIVESELIGLDLLKKEEVKSQNPTLPLYRKYFPHGISHHLGLDVHDVGSRFETFKAGMVFTCEPGIYIPAEKLGIRLENNIVITSSGNFDLMDGVPIEVEEVEDLMLSK